MSIADRIYFSDKYSLEEECTGSLWIDGKMIYRKTIDVGYITGTPLQKLYLIVLLV